MLDVGFSELLLFGIVALIVLGPEKLPLAVRAAGRWYAQLRRMVTNVRNDIEQELQLTEMRDLMQKELARIKDAELNLQQQMNLMNANLASLTQGTRVPLHDSEDRDLLLKQSPDHIDLPYDPVSIVTQGLILQPWQIKIRQQLLQAQSLINHDQPNTSAEPPVVELLPLQQSLKLTAEA